MWHNFIHANICSTGDPGEGREGKTEKIFEDKMAEKIQNW